MRVGEEGEGGDGGLGTLRTIAAACPRFPMPRARLDALICSVTAARSGGDRGLGAPSLGSWDPEEQKEKGGFYQRTGSPLKKYSLTPKTVTHGVMQGMMSHIYTHTALVAQIHP